MQRRRPCNSPVPLRALLVLWVVTCLCLPACNAMADSLVVRVSGGLVRGTSHQGSVRFLGIPYGTAQRFQFPSLATPGWTDVLNASHPGPQCPQHCPPVIRDLYCLHDDQMSESCLFLNIYRPAYNLPAGKAFPVMLFIHGGGFRSGSGAAPLYNGDYLARVGRVIVVTINYRLGAFGFLPIFNSYDDVIGNLGLRDQQMALHWVKQNIAMFDGDPGKVTLFGEEAGCQSVGLHLTSLTSQPLFHSAILHSCPFTLPFRNKNESRQMANDFAAALGCKENDVSCFRLKSTGDILQAQDTATSRASSRAASLRTFQAWGPVVDQRDVYDTNLLEELTNTKTAQSKPVMIGFLSQEGRTSVYRNFPLAVSSNFFQRMIQAELPETWRQVTETPETPYHSGDSAADARGQMVRFLNDFVYICPAQRVASLLSDRDGTQGQQHNVWTYNFDPQVTWSPGGSAWPPGGEPYCRNEACQGLDLLYLFNPSAIPESRRAVTEGLTKAMVFYWTSFAKHHNPNGRRTRAGAVQRGSLARRLAAGRGAAAAPPPPPSSQQSSIPTGFPSLFPRNTNLATSLRRLLQGANSAVSPSASQPRPTLDGAAGVLGSGSGSGLGLGLGLGFLRFQSARRGQFGGLQFRQTLGFTGSGSGSGSRSGSVSRSGSRSGSVSGTGLAALLSHVRSRQMSGVPARPSAAAAGPGAVRGLARWPRHSTVNVLTSGRVNVTLVLTQPRPVARGSLFRDACGFWDIVGYS